MNESDRTREVQIAKMREALARDSDMAPFADRIRILPGNPWRIEGEVTSIAARRKAARVARGALPQVEVEDGVRLARDIRHSDPELGRVLREALRAEPALEGAHVLEPGSQPPPLHSPWVGGIACEGVIYLGGWLDNLAAKAVAEAIAWETGACSDVKNLICHEPRCSHFDEDIAQALRTLIGEHPGLAGQQIEVTVEHAEVTLTGTVSESAQRDLARSLCWCVPSVWEVHDRLAVA